MRQLALWRLPHRRRARRGHRDSWGTVHGASFSSGWSEDGERWRRPGRRALHGLGFDGSCRAGGSVGTARVSGCRGLWTGTADASPLGVTKCSGLGGELPSLRVVSQRAVPDQAPQRTLVTTGVTGPLQEKAPTRGFPPLRCGVTARSRLTSVTVPEEG